MLDLFTIFSKGGIVLWCFQGSDLSLTSSVNNLIKSVILQERGGLGSFTHEALTIKYKLDNEFELVFVVAYQKFLQLSYVDKFLNDMQIEFRNRYKDDLSQGKLCRNLDSFNEFFKDKLKEVEETRKNEAKAPKMMRKFEESDKSKKTVASMIEHRKDDDVKKNVKKKNKPEKVTEKVLPVTNGKPKGSPKNPVVPESVDSSDQTDALILENRQKLFERNKKQPIKSPELIKTPDASKKSSKQKRQWELSGTSKDAAPLDYSDTTGDAETYTNGTILPADQIYDSMKGELKDIESESSDSDEETTNGNKTSTKTNNKKGTFSLFSGLRNLVGSKVLTRENIQSALEKMKDHLIAKNVAADISARLCESVATRLEGKVLGTFKTVTSTVKQALEEACVQILIPRRRIDILRDAMEAKQKRNPYVITFCGVNGVGKSTNLAKICFWLIENDFRVLIAACDTFRAGAVEQLRTHCRKLDAIHNADRHNGQRMVQLYEKGYGKDDAGIAMEAINHARDQHFDVVLIDTAGRMQGNEPLMRSLAKLIKVNQPDLVLFVGEALVGNDAVDQLVKFNQALADFSSMENPHLIDGIVLTKFDTIDDKVGAAISMTYITGQPIVFVGTGQTYTDLKNLNARSVVHALLKS